MVKTHGFPVKIFPNKTNPVNEIRQETDTATTAEERLERPRLSTSAARRMRRKRAAERAAQAALEHRGEKVAPLSAGRATRTY